MGMKDKREGGDRRRRQDAKSGLNERQQRPEGEISKKRTKGRSSGGNDRADKK